MPQDHPRSTFPSDGKVLVVGPLPSQRIQARYHRRVYFWSASQVIKPADIPDRAKAVLVFTHLRPPSEFKRVWDCAENSPYRRKFDSDAALSEQLAHLLNGINTLVDPDEPTAQPSIQQPSPSMRPHFPSAIEVRSPTVQALTKGVTKSEGGKTSPTQPEEVSTRIAELADFSSTDDQEQALRLYYLLGGSKCGWSTDQIVQEFRKQRASRSSVKPAPAVTHQPTVPPPVVPKPETPKVQPPTVPLPEVQGAIEIPRTRIRPFKNQPRTYFDPVELERLARSIKAVGQKVPIIVRRIKGDPNHDYELIDGERRWRACEIAQIPTMLAVVRFVANYEDQKLTSVVANFNQAPHTPLETARLITEIQGYEEIKVLPASQAVERIVEIFGKTTAWVYQQRNLLNLHPRVQVLMEPITAPKHRINASIGIALCSVSDPALQVSIAEEISRQGMKTNEARNYIQRRMREAEVGKAGRQRHPIDEQRIVRGFLQRTAEGGKFVLNIPKRSIKELLGGINQDELDRLIDQAEEGLAALTLILDELKKLQKTAS